MESKFQFTEPILEQITFKINNYHGPETITLTHNLQTQIDKLDSSQALVKLHYYITSDEKEMPFDIAATMRAIFKWDSAEIDSSQSDVLLNQNAPLLLLSYLRPIIANITNAGVKKSYNIPFMDFKNAPPDQKENT